MLGNQNDGQQWEVFCGLPCTCKVAQVASFHSSLWFSGKQWAAEVCGGLSPATEGACFFFLFVCLCLVLFSACKGVENLFQLVACLCSTTVLPSLFLHFYSCFSSQWCRLWMAGVLTRDVGVSRWNKQHPYFMNRRKINLFQEFDTASVLRKLWNGRTIDLSHSEQIL